MRDEVEGLVVVRQVGGVRDPEGHSSRGIEADLAGRRANHLLGDVDAANARLRELTRQQQRPRAGAGAHLECTLGCGLHVEEGRGQRSEVLHRARRRCARPSRPRSDRRSVASGRESPATPRARARSAGSACVRQRGSAGASVVAPRSPFSDRPRVVRGYIHRGHLAVPLGARARPASLGGRCRLRHECSPQPSSRRSPRCCSRPVEMTAKGTRPLRAFPRVARKCRSHPPSASS